MSVFSHPPCYRYAEKSRQAFLTVEGAGHEVLHRGDEPEKPRDSDQQTPRYPPTVNEQYDRAINQWQRINDELEMDKPIDLARGLMMQGKAFLFHDLTALVGLMVCHLLYEISLSDTPLPTHSESKQPFDACYRLRLRLQQLGDLFETERLFVMSD